MNIARRSRFWFSNEFANNFLIGLAFDKDEKVVYYYLVKMRNILIIFLFLIGRFHLLVH